MEQSGVLPLDWPGRGAVLASLGFYEDAKDPGEAAKKWFQRNPADRARLAVLEGAAAGCGENANGGTKRYRRSPFFL